ncbi:MAG: hypothetical protein C0601_00550 [Candidatus Muiribacterium halophilum]|uniref:Pilus assembly protein PilO n=1 Tax=Muiribacterium halophilum TaxID=2053465 RepID=A0A2N5ZMV2_MUIH1|nr:MAG: hypothetical protein C0601_00550 [Candidatus Muirbacterium halophilum]
MKDKLIVFLMFIVVMLAICGYWYWTVYMEYQDKKGSLDKSIAKLEKEISGNASKRLQDDIDKMKSEKKKLDVEYSQKINSVVTDKDMSIPDLIRVVRNYAKQTDVEFNEIKINKIYPQDYFDELPMEFNFTGPYHKIGRMMARMENLKLINARRGKFSLAAHKKTNSNASSSFSRRRSFSFQQEEESENEVSLDLSASSYIFKSKGGGLGVPSY